MKKQVSILTLAAIIYMGLNLNTSPANSRATGCNDQSSNRKSSAGKWTYRRKIAIENHNDQLNDAIIEVQFNSGDFNYSMAKPDGSDIRFSVNEGEIKGDGIPYWIEQWNQAGVSRIWIKVPVIESQGQTTIYMYYGNTQSLPASNGNTTFLFFDDFKDGDYTRKWTNISVDSVMERGGLLKLKGFDNKDGIVTAKFKITGQMIIRTLYQRGGADQHWTRAGVGGWNNWLCFGDYTDWAGIGTNYVMFLDSASIANLKSKPPVKAPNSVINDKWRRVAFWNDGNNLKGMEDTTMIAWPGASGSSNLSLRTLDNDNWDNFAYITVSPYFYPEPVINVGAQTNN